MRRREGSSLLRSKLTDGDPPAPWRCHLQFIEIEQAYKALKRDPADRPVYHRCSKRIEARIVVDFIAYCLQGISKQRIRAEPWPTAHPMGTKPIRAAEQNLAKVSTQPSFSSAFAVMSAYRRTTRAPRA